MYDQPMETQPGVPPKDYAQLSDAVNQFSSGHLRIHHHTRDDSPLMRQTLENLDAVLNDPVCQIVKSDNTTTVGMISCDGKKFIVKRYNTKNLWHYVRRSVRRARAQNCWHFAHLLPGLGISTAPAVAWIQETAGPLKARSWFVSEFIEGPTCQEYLTPGVDLSQAQAIMGRIVDTLKILREHRITHGDLKASNILLRWERPVLIDLDATYQHRTVKSYHNALNNDVRRFLQNWQNSPQLLDIARRLLAAENFSA
jgi:serine/threonine protein kinase